MQMPIKRFKFFAVAAMTAFAASKVLAHHPTGGEVPSTAWQGLLSGLGHPIIEIDHLLFLFGAAFVAAFVGAQPKRALFALAVYALAGMLGTVFRAGGIEWAMTEWLVPLSLLVLAFSLWLCWVPAGAITLVMVVIAGMGHGYAYGEAILGSEMGPLAWYLFGLFLIQTLLMTSTYVLVRHLLVRSQLGSRLTARALSVVLSATAAFAMLSGLSV